MFLFLKRNFISSPSSNLWNLGQWPNTEPCRYNKNISIIESIGRACALWCFVTTKALLSFLFKWVKNTLSRRTQVGTGEISRGLKVFAIFATLPVAGLGFQHLEQVGSWLLTTPAPGDLTPISGLCRCPAHTYRIFTHIITNKIKLRK